MKKQTIVVALLIFSALSISGAAAFFSVYGLSKVFAGASLAVTIMASILEASKLITAYILHQDSAKFPKALKVYLSIAVAVLMAITSAGIYGFLSSAYQETASRNDITSKEIGIVEVKRGNFEEQLLGLQNEKQSIVNDIAQLRNGLSSGTTVQYVDKATGQLVTSTSSSARKALEDQLEDATKRRDEVNKKIEEVSESVNTLAIEILEKQSTNEAASELGPLMYLSSLTGVSMDRVMNYFILMIIFVFDPLAICLVIAMSHTVNFYAKLKQEEEDKKKEEEAKEQRRLGRRVRLYGTTEAPKRGRPQNKKTKQTQKKSQPQTK
jgi:hypothetical protein